MKNVQAVVFALSAFVAGLIVAPSAPASAGKDPHAETLEMLCKRFHESDAGKTLKFMSKQAKDAADDPTITPVTVSLMAVRDMVCVRK